MTDAPELDEAAAREAVDADAFEAYNAGALRCRVVPVEVAERWAIRAVHAEAGWERNIAQAKSAEAALDEIERLRAALNEARADLAAETSRADDLNHEVLNCDRLALLDRAEAAESEAERYHAEAEAAYRAREAAESALAAVRALHDKTHWCFGGDNPADLCDDIVFEPGTEYWPCPTLAVLPAPTSPERSESDG